MGDWEGKRRVAWLAASRVFFVFRMKKENGEISTGDKVVKRKKKGGGGRKDS